MAIFDFVSHNGSARLKDIQKIYKIIYLMQISVIVSVFYFFVISSFSYISLIYSYISLTFYKGTFSISFNLKINLIEKTIFKKINLEKKLHIKIIS